MISDQMPIVFDATICSPLCTVSTPSYRTRYMHSLTANQFAEAYQRNATATSISSAAELLLSPDKFISVFYSSSSAILDSVDPPPT